ncbi:hypothetical protein [Streptomyces sp. Tue6028]|uniref:hypothetical protein n=1 Tax=Streptomyces sp. Tue6028 TaxID=2036037 RepID=UPI003D747E01
MNPKQFRDWARRRRIAPAGSRLNPNRGQALALWDLADIRLHSSLRHPSRGVPRQPGRSSG